MKFFIKTVFYSVFLSIIIIACCKKRNYNFLLSDEDLKWNPYVQGQNISFKSNMQDTESFEVSEVKRFSSNESQDCMDISREWLSVIIQLDSNYGGTMYIIATYDGSAAPAKVNWQHNPSQPHYIYLPPEPPSTSMLINGKNYTNVYEINLENAGVDTGSVEKYYFNKEYGFLKYVYKSGKYYELIK